ncbi:replication-associated recombination protein A [Shimazuella alba]|uniref:Replication-associated recombination protein A n=1 Tax=Shimazuella alba TaxID=2690964 RepID=A0A6I4VWW5_9BACL|nr:replication-associated recombination protein A [Shimazuella alba]MXQ54346.1 AAA family ATPase [Shimazuella alba]
MNLFSHLGEEAKQKKGPLASRMRPRSLHDFIGQQHLIGEGKLLRRAIEADQLTSLILHGPPGTGKTTLAEIIANSTDAAFIKAHAVGTGANDIKQIAKDAMNRLAMEDTRTILFIDEIHRLNRAQQDVLLPDVEDGGIILIGATTENPSYEVNTALLSRSLVFELNALSTEEVISILNHALHDKERGLGMYTCRVEEEALLHLAQKAGGDTRHALNALELAVITTKPDTDGVRHLTLSVAEECIQQKRIRYDKKGDGHYDSISAFIKSMRGSDPDATLYYLAKMLLAGEDPKFIARRILIQAAEDVGLADPRALMVASAAAHAVEYVGMPEARIPLAEAALYLATAPKSNSAYMGINKAMEAVKKEYNGEVPPSLQNHKQDEYKYPHNYDNHYIEQQYLPHEHKNKTFYQPGYLGYEGKVIEHLNWVKNPLKEEK